MPISDVDPKTIEQALHDFDVHKRKNWEGWEANQQHRYAILWKSRSYPVKEIIRMATDADEFWGGPESNEYLKKRGFVITSLDSIRKTDEILQRLLQEIKKARGCLDLRAAASILKDESSNEIEGRFTFFNELNSLLRRAPLSLPALKEVVQQRDNDLLGGHGALRAQLNAFFRTDIEDQTEKLIRDLLGDFSKPPTTDQINTFVNEAASLAFHDSKKHPQNANAALFVSILLTAAFPADFVDFRQNRWRNFADTFILDTFSTQANYGEMLRWAGHIAQQFTSTPTFQQFFESDRPNWIVAAWAWDLERNEWLRELIRKVPNGPIDGIVLLSALSNYFTSKGYSFPPTLLATFITALQTKGFVILSGLSGTGKTKLAQHLAELLPGPEETTEIPPETTEEGDIYIQIQPYMLKYARIIIPKSNWQLIDVPPAGESAEITVTFDNKSQKCRLIHAVYTGDYLQLLLKGQARKWFVENFKPDDTLILQPQTSSDDNEFTGFSFLKPLPLPPIQRRQLPNHVFVSVRPDWRDAKSLLGYFNPITDEYIQTNFLQFLLQAKTHYDQAGAEALPHFVVLDEMNLARVEYYFADLLSILESGRKAGYTRESITLHNRPLERSLDAHGRPIPQSLALPPNLYIIGTVNMDETTHAFSPKVLDRAFTIEFNEVDFSYYPPQQSAFPEQIETGKLQMALLTSFQRSGKFAQIDKGEIAEIVQADEQGYRNHLQTLNHLLTGFDLHFGYRVFDEIAQFMAIASKGDLFDDLNTAFDLAVLMKVLPKFNGPRSRLRLPLETVIAWAKNPLSPTLTDISNAVKDADSCRNLLPQLPVEYTYPETARKALRMLIRLHETGFASFA